MYREVRLYRFNIQFIFCTSFPAILACFVFQVKTITHKEVNRKSWTIVTCVNYELFYVFPRFVSCSILNRCATKWRNFQINCLLNRLQDRIEIKKNLTRKRLTNNTILPRKAGTFLLQVFPRQCHGRQVVQAMRVSVNRISEANWRKLKKKVRISLLQLLCFFENILRLLTSRIHYC